MATQSVIHSVPQQKSAVVIPINQPKQITQYELEAFICARNLIKQQEAKLAAMEANLAPIEADLKARLEAGASVEEGVHLAELKESFRRTPAWKEIARDLANLAFGEGEGTTYCDQVLAGTVPARTVSLDVQ